MNSIFGIGVNPIGGTLSAPVANTRMSFSVTPISVSPSENEMKSKLIYMRDEQQLPAQLFVDEGL